MIKDKRFALTFRLGALIFALIGLMKQTGVFTGTINAGFFMYYTIQSNLLVVVLFAMLVMRAFKSLKEGVYGNTGWFARFEMICTVDILLTLVVFWALLVPQVSLSYILTFENFAVHTITPLLCLADYILFTGGRFLKYRDVYYTCLFPAFYLIFTLMASLAGYVYYFEVFTESALNSSAEMTPVRVPYFFLDYEKIGGMAAVYVLIIMFFILLMGHVFYLINRKARD